MDWKLLLSTFTSIFVAEIGDKTQIATMSLAAGGRSKLAVFIGAALALCATSALGVLVGEGVSRLVPPVWMRRIAGAVFIVIGVLFLVGREG
jgi:putative Ca2+/H+ antiporter (TMEM165/GDT1 family)